MNAPEKQLIAASPVLHAHDYPATIAYYRDILGFTVCWSFEQYPYGCVERDGVEINIGGRLSELDVLRLTLNSINSFDIYIYVSDVDSLFIELKGRGADCILEPKDYPYGMREFGVRDPNGYQLIFGQDISSKSAELNS